MGGIRGAAMSTLLLEVEGLSKTYRSGRRRIVALDGASLVVRRGETLALVGASGSGKSTLARLVSRLDEPGAGSLRFDGGDLLAVRGRALRSMRRRFQMVFQEPLQAFNPRATVARVIGDPLRIHRIATRSERPGAIARLLEAVGLSPGLAARGVHEISGGQRQRVAIARALATRPDLIILDEAVSALDVTIRTQILMLLRRIQAEEGVSYLFITHDLSAARAIAHRIAVMAEGRIVEEAAPAELLDHPGTVSAQRLVAAMPRLRFSAGTTP